MTDILDKLGSTAMVFYEYDCDGGALLKEAAAEIRRLREEKKKWHHIARTSYVGEYKALREVERLKIQVQELKEALRAIVSEYMGSVTKKEIARKALAKLGGDDAL